MISILTAGKTALSRLKTTIDLADQLKKLLRVLLHSRTLTKGHPGFLPLNFLVECGAQFGKNRFDLGRFGRGQGFGAQLFDALLRMCRHAYLDDENGFGYVRERL